MSYGSTAVRCTMLRRGMAQAPEVTGLDTPAAGMALLAPVPGRACARQ
jgi:hypothetical protein